MVLIILPYFLFWRCLIIIIDNLPENQIGILVTGNNRKWKQEINVGKINNQNFVQILHHQFIEQFKYKAELVGIKVTIEE